MNYLAHLYLSDPDDGHRLGNLAGDWIKGRLSAHDLPLRVLDGVRRHRAVDRYSDRHPLMARARARLPAHRRRAAGIILDVLWDHFLVKHWGDFQRCALDRFLADCYGSVRRMAQHWPPAARGVLSRMITEDWLSAYGELDTVGYSLERIARRMRRDPGLSGSLADIRRHYVALEADFLAFDLFRIPRSDLPGVLSPPPGLAGYQGSAP